MLEELCSSESRATLPDAKLVAKLQAAYSVLGVEDRRALLVHMAVQLGRGASGASPEESIRRFEAVSKATGGLAAALVRLREELTPRNELLCFRLARENGLAFLLHLRSDLLRLVDSEKATARLQEEGEAAAAATLDAVDLEARRSEALTLLDASLKKVLAQFFSVGFLELKRITYEGTGGGVLEKIARYETVHKVRGLSDLKARLGRSRRCYALFHPCVPAEPLVFVHVALLPRVADSMAYIHHHSGYPVDTTTASLEDHSECDEREETARAAIFYSINSTQPGLRGVELGNFLIKRVAHQLRGELPSLETFCTLSPVPGFTRWLRRQASKADDDDSKIICVDEEQRPFLSADEGTELRTLLLRLSRPNAESEEAGAEEKLVCAISAAGESVSSAASLIVQVIDLQVAAPAEASSSPSPSSPSSSSSSSSPSSSSGHPSAAATPPAAPPSPGWSWWHAEQGAVAAELKPFLLRLAARYLAMEKRPFGSGRGALDPVANFHCRNGASLYGVHWGADLSSKGLDASCGVMVNYLYDLAAIAHNSEAYAAAGTVRCSSEQVKGLLCGGDSDSSGNAPVRSPTTRSSP